MPSVDGPPLGPANSCRGIDEDDPSYGWVLDEIKLSCASGAQCIATRSRSTASCQECLLDLALNLREHSLEELLLAGEVVIKRTSAHAGAVKHLLDRGLLIPVFGEQLTGGLHQAISGRSSAGRPSIHPAEASKPTAGMAFLAANRPGYHTD